jgi:hypothetical protein
MTIEAHPGDINMIIVLRADGGTVVVDGPLDNKVLSYGMLERARDAIQNYQPDNAGLIVPMLPTQ